MSFDSELQNKVEGWLDAEYKNRAGHIVDGACKNFEEYKERCGELRMIREIGKSLHEFVREINDVPVQNKNGETE